MTTKKKSGTGPKAPRAKRDNELDEKDLQKAVGGSGFIPQKPTDGSGGGNVVAKWDIATKSAA
jgi:hypothetical protein